MRSTLLIASVIVLSASCYSSCSGDGKSSDNDNNLCDSVSEEKYVRMLSDLTEMFDAVNAKAKCILDSGVNKRDLRSHLVNDPEYCRICSESKVIDSTLTSYIKSGRATPDFLREYNEATARAAKKAQKTGLY